MMTGQIATEVSDAASTGIFDIYQQKWAKQIIEATQLPDRLFPPVLQSYDIAGELSEKAAIALGLQKSIPIIAGCADQPAQAIGNGILRTGLASVTIGSGGQVFLPIQADEKGVLHTDRRIHVFNHAASGWYALGAILSAGLSLRWLRDLLGMSQQKDAYQLLSAEAAKVNAGADGLIFLPYLNGERTPYMDSSVRGAFIGLSGHHHRGHMARAIMEGVAYAMRQALEACETVGQPAEKIIASGGGLESSIWRQIFTDVLNRPLRKSLQKEQAVLGATILAAVGTHYFVPTGSIEDNFAAIQPKLAQYGAATEPRNASFYDEQYQHFCELYPRLKADFHRLSQ
jgi:xylulokinase